MPNDAVVSPEILSELKAKLTEMIGALGLEIAISSAKAEGDTAYFNLNGKDSAYLLEHHAEPIKSMALLLQTWLDHAHGAAGRVVKLDAEGELRGKDDELTILARQVCDSLTQVGQERRLEALNPYDRRIVHMVVGERPEFETESLGSGHFKNMIIRRIK